MERKKLLVLTSTFPRWKNDTLPPFVYELSKRLTDKFDVTVLAPSYPGAKDFEIMDKMKVYRFHYFIRQFEKLAGSGGILPVLSKNPFYYFVVPFFLLGEYLAAKKLVEKERPDIIHAHWIIPQGLIAYFIKKKFNIPYVVTSHGSDIFGLQQKFLIDLKRKVLKEAKHITGVSNAIKDEILKLVPEIEVSVIPMGVDSKLFNPKKRDLSIKKKYGIKGPFLLFVGRLTEKKGVRYLIEAMPEVIKRYPEAKLMIIGTGELEKELKELAIKLNVNDNIIFMGAIQNKDLPKYYATADIFIGPSIITKYGDREGSPVAFVEAGMCGCWLIVSNLEGIKEIIINKRNGIYFKEKNTNELINSIFISIKLLNKSKNNFYIYKSSK